MNAFAAGAWLGAAGVALGAFGAHGLQQRLAPDRLDVFQTGVRYHLVHALALLAVGLLARQGGLVSPWPARLFLVGLVLFSGSLYALALGAPRGLGLVTPLGGLLLIAGWVSLALAAR